MIEKTIKFILHYHRGLIVATLLLTAILAFWFVRIEIGAAYSGIFPPKDDPERAFFHRTRDEFGSEHVLYIVIRHDSIFSFPTLSKIENLTSRISEHLAVDRVLGLTNANVIKAKDDEIYLQNIMGKVPSTEREIEQFEKDIFQNPIYVGNLVSEDGKTTVISVFLDTTYPREVVMRTIEQIQGLAQSASGPEEMYFAGGPTIRSSIFKMLASDLSNYVPLTLLMIAVIMLINFRNWWCTVVPLIFAFIAIVWTYAFMALFKVQIFILTAIIPPVITALGISYSIHLFTEYFRQRTLENNSKRIVERTLRNILLAIWLSIITTASGFACLFMVGIVAIRQFSIFLAIGVLSLLLLITFFIPSILVYIRPKLGINRIRYGRFATGASSRFVDHIVRHRHHILIIAALVTIPGAWGTMKLRVETNIYEFFKPSAPIRKAGDVMVDHLHGTTQFSIVIEGQKEGDLEDPSLLKSIESLQTFLDQLPYVGKSKSAVDYLKTINKAFHNNNPEYYILPESKDEISQYLLIYSLADPARSLDRYLDYHHRVARISLRTTLMSSASMLKFKQLIEEQCSKSLPPNTFCKTTGEPVLFATSARNISNGILFSFGLAALAISIVMFLLFRSFKIGIVAMIPNLLPLLSILALMGWARIDFNIGTSLVICIAIGIAVDDTIHFLTRYFHELKRSNHYLVRRYTDQKITADQLMAIRITFNHVKRPIILTSVVIFFGFMILAFSQFVPIIHLGTLTAITMIFCLLCDMILLPAILASVSI